jgi:hypothetical protein
MTFRGYHPDHTLPFKRGDTVWVPKGTLISGTYGPPKVSTRNQKVVVHHLMPGSMALLARKSDGNRLYIFHVDKGMIDVLVRAGATEALKILQGPNVDLFAEEVIQDLDDRGLLRWDGEDGEDGEEGYLVLSNPKVVWPGSGGYWREADINEVKAA